MAELSPVPFPRLIARAFEELDHNGSIFDLPRRKFVLEARHDTSVAIHGRRVATPLGPSAGPHTQLAQNIVLCWLGGARVIELKTVQILDAIRVARPCIDVRAVGYNVEWSQELSLEQSLEEYVKASMLIEMLAKSGVLPMQQAFAPALFDVSVGYDLEGIRSDRIAAFLDGLLDARGTVERLRGQIPAEHRALRELDFTTAIARGATLSTFHGCPPAEVESIAAFLMSEVGIDCAIKLNPTLLGRDAVVELLNDRLGYTNVVVPPHAFESDPTWGAATAMIGRLQTRARLLGRNFAVKLTNTLVVENQSDFLPRTEKLAYLSGAPLHVIAMHLLRRIRRTFGDSLPISFSAGIDRMNYPDAVSLGIAPVTVCTDLLKQGGYGRLAGYGAELEARMDAVGASTIDEFILRARGHEALSLSQARVLNTEEYVEGLAREPRYGNERAGRMARRTGTALGAFECATCDLCLTACPNAAVFRIPSGHEPIPHAHAIRDEDGTWSYVDSGAAILGKPHQIAIFADACNDCGNCEAFCPEVGAPNRLKLRFYGSEAAWRGTAGDGFFVESARVLGRIGGREFLVRLDGTARQFSGPECHLTIRDDAVTGTGSDHAQLWPLALMEYARTAVLDRTRLNFINCSATEEPT